MIEGSGLLASAFENYYQDSSNVIIYAAGVSNSHSTNSLAFETEQSRLSASLQRYREATAFVYFGTCSVYDVSVANSAYVKHKTEMENLVRAHPNYLIIRLPIVVGYSTNPHTLLNYLFSCITSSVSFDLWRYATRNVIDVDHVSAISHKLINNRTLRQATINVANTVNYSVVDIVNAMETLVGKPARYNLVNAGSTYPIDVSFIQSIIRDLNLNFDTCYLSSLLRKYYFGRPALTSYSLK